MKLLPTKKHLLYSILSCLALLLGSLAFAATNSRTPKEQKITAPAPAAVSAPARPAAPQLSPLECAPIGFGHNTLVDFSATSGEPFINSAPVTVAPNTPAGSPFISVPFGLSTSVSILWKSIDGGRSFIQLGAPIVRDAVPAPGGGDTHQDFDALGRFYYSDLAGACVTVAVSDDGGNTFPKVNPLACVGPNDPGGVTDDRQWSGGFGDGRGYMTTRNLQSVPLLGNFHLARTRDAGVTWNSFNQAIGTVTQSGPLVVDKTKRNIDGTDYIHAYQIYYTGGTLKVLRLRDNDTGGATVQVSDLTILTPGGSVATVFPMIAVDRAGNLYVTWSDSNQIRMVTSQDFGQTWSGIKVVSGPAPPAAKIMPWAIAGDAGRANIVWYQSTQGLGNAVTNRWDILMAQTLDGLAASPTFETTQVNEHTIHFGEICLAGLNCDIAVPPGSRDRSFLEFPSITLDHRGAAQITWNDNTNQSAVTAAAPQVTGAPYVMFGKQTRGPSLFASVGMVDQSPGTVTITEPTAGQQVTTAPFDVGGTHTLPPGTFDNDELGDARFPDHGPTIGANVPALDIRKVTITDNATSLIVKMEIADLTTAALAAAAPTTGGDGLLYLTQWDYDQSTAEAIDRVFWVAAEVRAGVPVARTGTLGVIRSSTSKKYITYNPVLDDSTQVMAVIAAGTPGTITLTIPRSLVGSPPNGAALKTVTAYAMSERGALTPCPDNTQVACENIFTPTSLPLKVDASGAFTYIVGGGPQFDGTVEFSLDDPSFASPRPATLDSANQNWQGQLSAADLTPGAHTLYARQTITCNVASPLASVGFSVPGGALQPTVVSRKTHGAAGAFDVSLPLTATAGVECRSRGVGNNLEIVFTFAAPVTVGGSTTPPPSAASVTGTGNVDSIAVNGAVVTVNLSGVSNAQQITLTLNSVSDGSTTGSVAVPIGVLLGDTSADRAVNSADITETRRQSGEVTAAGNFRTDVSLDAVINSADITAVRRASGSAIP